MIANRKHSLRRALSIFSAGIVLLFAWNSASLALSFPGEEKIAHETLVDQLSQGGPEDLIIIFDEAPAVRTAADLRALSGASHDTEEIVRAKASMYRSMKAGVLSGLSIQDVETVKDYSHLPAMFVRVKSLEGLKKLAAQAEVMGIHKNRIMHHMLAESLPLINQPAAEAAGFTGAGTAVAVIDGRVDYTNPYFNCSSTPPDCATGLSSSPGCKIACVHNYVSASFDDHGTNVSAIVSGVAPDTRIIGLTVFNDSGNASVSVILAAINWAIANKASYNITAINMSLGDSSFNSAPCYGDSFATPVSQARAAGILSAIAAGNDTYTNALSSPACVPAAVSVGAVYDANMGGIGFGDCSDPTTAPDKITCFSNNASFLTLLAPGCYITAAGISMCGTSQATPHVAGAIAVIRSGFPSETVGDTVNRMIDSGKPVTDSRDPFNPITKPRLDLSAAVTATDSISGRVTKPSGVPLAGITIHLAGAGSGTTTTDASGYYSFAGLAAGSYTVTPSSSTLVFAPVRATVSLPATGVNFVAQIFRISGVIRTSSGAPVPGVTVTLSGGPSNLSVLTGADGVFAFEDLENGHYTVTPTFAGYSFVPLARDVVVSGADQINVDFIRAFIISGFVRAKRGLMVFPDVTITLSGASSMETVTDSTGYYQFVSLLPGSYTVTPKKLSFVFSPTTKGVSLQKKNVTLDFKVTTYTISGIVKTGAGAPMSGVSLTVTGCGIAANAVTDSKGKFKISNLPNCNYTISPSDSSGHIFTPGSAPATVNNTNVAGIAFSGP
jgi:protocatechuate 3,4-dioxygenase beta subunit